MTTVSKVLDVGDTAPDFTLPDAATGEELRLAQWAGRDVLLVFFRGTWCPFCREQMRVLTQQHGDLEAAGVQVAGIVCQSEASGRRWVAANPLPFPLLVDESRAVAKRYGVHYWLSFEGFNLARPSLFILDGERRITFRHVGRSMSDLPVTTILECFVRLLRDNDATESPAPSR